MPASTEKKTSGSGRRPPSPEERTVELRWAGGGRIHGTVVPYGEIAPAWNERWESGAAYWTPGSVKLNLMHLETLDLQLTSQVELRNAPHGLEVRIDLPETASGQAARNLVQAGIMSGLSAEFIAKRERREGTLRVIERAEIVGVGLVDRPSFPSARAEARSNRQARLRKAKLWL